MIPYIKLQSLISLILILILIKWCDNETNVY